MIWIVKTFTSGTHIVTRNDLSKPHLYVYAKRRLEVCRELKDWLNGGTEPSWLQHLIIHPKTEETCTGPEEINISAVGPMFLPADDNCRLAWQTDESEKAKQARINLIDHLLRRDNNGLDY